MKKFNPDLTNYHHMSQPHESAAQANEALELFFHKVNEARSEFKISDVLIVVKDKTHYQDGEIGEFFHLIQIGDMTNMPRMAAYAFGKVQAEQREFLNKLIANKK